MRRAELAQLIDHTLLAPTATRAEVLAVCAEATALDVAAVCLAPVHLPLPAGYLGHHVATAAVVGFPSGAHRTEVKAAEAARAVADGATELDMVIDLGAAKAGDWVAVEADIAGVRAAAPAPTVLKVIIESAALTADEIVQACRAAEDAGADFVKTSTGFHPSGGAVLEDVQVMRRTVGDRLGVKASGGIRTAEQALAMVAAGASRLGCSATGAILDGLPE